MRQFVRADGRATRCGVGMGKFQYSGDSRRGDLNTENVLRCVLGEWRRFLGTSGFLDAQSIANLVGPQRRSIKRGRRNEN